MLAPGLAAPNLLNRPVVVAAMRKALDDLAARDRQITVVVPDAAVRVLLLDFDTLPSKTADILPVIRFRLRKLVPFEVEEACNQLPAHRHRELWPGASAGCSNSAGSSGRV